MQTPEIQTPIELPSNPDREHQPRPIESDPHATFVRTSHFASLNGLRCICALAVIKLHVAWESGPRLADLGWLGVDMFFIISGFLIVTLLIRERCRKGQVNLKNFYARRTLRIFPIYYLMIFVVFAAYAAVSPWAPSGLRFYLPALPILLTYTVNFFICPALGVFSHCWSLSAEEQFYLVWPMVERFGGTLVRWGVFATLLLVNVAIGLGAFDSSIIRLYGTPDALSLPIYQITFTPILLGVLLAHLLQNRRSYQILYRLTGFPGAPLVYLVVLLTICESYHSVVRGVPRLGLHLCLTLLLTSLVVRENHVARPFLTIPLLDHLGMTSYGIYLYHTWVIFLIHSGFKALHLAQPSSWQLFVLATIATCGVAELSYRLIERPLHRVRGRFAS